MRHVMKLCRFIHTVISDGYTLAYTGTDTALYRISRKYRGLPCLRAVTFSKVILEDAHSKFLS
jgi:hypothetical protein